MVKSIEVEAPYQLLVKLRDKFWPSHRIALRTEIGLLPYDKNDLVVSSLVRGTFEPEEQGVMRALLPACRGMMDVGANLGLYTLLASRLMPSDSQIVAFEASPIEHAKLAWTVLRNKLANVEVIHAAVSDALGTTTIYQSLAGAGALNRLDRPAKTSGEWEPTKVSMTTIDAWAATHGKIPIDLLKIDVEGHELPVLVGAQSLIRNWRPLILIEVNAARASARSAPREIWDHVVGMNYRWFAIQPGANMLTPAEEPGNAINFLAVPCEPLGNTALAGALSTLSKFG
jgi:FkbM family methyltransferase